MNRLLFAAARGARLQTESGRNGAWAETSWLHNTHTPARIHPGDAHLAYGPISTALREIAANLNAEPMYSDEFGTWMLPYSDWCDCRDLASKRDVPLFLLILAEALADEGL